MLHATYWLHIFIKRQFALGGWPPQLCESVWESKREGPLASQRRACSPEEGNDSNGSGATDQSRFLLPCTSSLMDLCARNAAETLARWVECCGNDGVPTRRRTTSRGSLWTTTNICKRDVGATRATINTAEIQDSSRRSSGWTLVWSSIDHGGNKFVARENKVLATLLRHMWRLTKKRLQLHIQWVRGHKGKRYSWSDCGTRSEMEHLWWKRSLLKDGKNKSLWHRSWARTWRQHLALRRYVSCCQAWWTFPDVIQTRNTSPRLWEQWPRR